MRKPTGWPLVVVFLAMLTGCQSPYYADRGALAGGLGGAGVGALIGEATGNPLAGAAIGAGVGAVGGAAVGSGLDEIEARNQAEIEARLGRPAPRGAVTLNDVIAMTRAGVDEDLIATHIRTNGAARPMQPGDLIALQQNGVSKLVIAALQDSTAGPLVVERPPRVIVEEPYYPPPWYPYYYGPPPRPYYGFEFSYHRGRHCHR